jgi:hypothetical protein
MPGDPVSWSDIPLGLQILFVLLLLFQIALGVACLKSKR